MRTSESLSPVSAPAVAASLAGFAAVYFLVFGAGVVYLLRLWAEAPGLHRDHIAEGPLRTDSHEAAREEG
jgi:cytochrome d ubiquinol oxidase subunit I